MRRAILGLAAAVFMGVGAAAADPPRTPVEALVGLANAELYVCGLNFELALAGGPNGEAGRCVADKREALAGEYEKAKAQFAKQPRSLELLKDFYAAWRTSLDALAPRPGESRGFYVIRREAVEASLKARGERLLLE